MIDAFFRAGVGIVVRDDMHRILCLRRKNTPGDAWQLPQGGIHADETPLDAMYRELMEETGLTRSDVSVEGSIEEWWVYELPVEYRNAKVGWGQAQRWYLCKLLVPPDAVRADQIEFVEFDWVTAEQLLAAAVPFRAAIYRRLVSTFAL